MDEFEMAHPIWTLVIKITHILAALALSYAAYKAGYEPEYRKSATRTKDQACIHLLMRFMGCSSSILAVIAAGFLTGFAVATGVLLILILPPYGIGTLAAWWFTRKEKFEDAISTTS